MSAKKNCVTCGKQIPDVAVVCVFCSAKQPAEEVPAATEASASSEAGASPEASVSTMSPMSPVSPVSPDPGASIATPTVESESALSKHATDPTLMGIRASDVMAEVESRQQSSTVDHGSNGTPAAHAATAQATAPSPAVATAMPPPEEIPEPSVEAPQRGIDRRLSTVDYSEPWAGLGRLIMGIGGAVLVALFFCPWHGVSSWQLLETLSGADFVRQLFYLTGGIVLLVSALLPLPFVFRAVVGASVAATPVVLGAGGVIEGWRGVVAALAILGLPATHLLRSRAQSSPAARLLVLAATAAVALLYVLPVSSVVPISAVFRMIASGSIGLAIMGVFVLIPLVFAALSLLGIAGRDLTDIGVLLSVLILLWAPVVVALRGLLLEDATQLYVAVGLLWASATAALSLAQLLARGSAAPRASA